MRCFASLLAAVLLHAVAVVAKEQLCFPDNFVFGTATAAYQVEGGWNEGGRTPSIWDEICHNNPTVDCANVADDFYHRYAGDIELMAKSNVKSFRFSISWSRLMHWDNSTKHMVPTPTGIAFYHAVIDALNKRDIAPILTIYHWDLPLELEHDISPGSWLNPVIQDHYLEFASLVMHEYGLKVPFWSTFNEPLVFTRYGYGMARDGRFPPGLKESNTTEYIAAHNVLLSHGKAVQLFRKLKTEGVVNATARIGIVLNCDTGVPADPSDPDDVAAVDNGLQFMLGWFMQPIVSGEYPTYMRERVGSRLPEFTPEEREMMAGSYDLFMLNHYSTHQVTQCDTPRSKTPCENMTLGWEKDLGLDYTAPPVGSRLSSKNSDGTLVCPGFVAYPPGYRDLINWVHSHNTSTGILLTENGFCGNAEIENKDQLWYYQTYLEQVHKAITEDKIPIVGYTAWSFMDNYEWGSFKPRYGLYFVNFTSQTGSKEDWKPKATDLTRVPRLAARWFAELAKTKCMDALDEEEQEGSAASVVAVAGSSTTWTSWTTWVTVVAVLASIAAIGFIVALVRRRRSGSASENASLLH